MSKAGGRLGRLARLEIVGRSGARCVLAADRAGGSATGALHMGLTFMEAETRSFASLYLVMGRTVNCSGSSEGMTVNCPRHPTKQGRFI